MTTPTRRAGAKASARMKRKRAKARTGLEPGPDGAVIGRDPRRLSPEELRGLGHRAAPLLQVMRRRCVDCCGGKTEEVRRCTAVACPLWPYRMATDPWREQRSTRPTVAPKADGSTPDAPAPDPAPPASPARDARADTQAAGPATTVPAPTDKAQTDTDPVGDGRRRRTANSTPSLPLFDDATTS